MKLHPRSTIFLLLVAMQLVSAYKFRCWLFCTEQTGVQSDYTEDRDNCRSYAQLQIETNTSNPELLDEKNRSAKLVGFFASCMADKGWTIPGGKAAPSAPAPAPEAAKATTETPPTPAAAPAPTPAAPAPNHASTQQREKAYLARSSECAFARHGAPYSSVSATRAQACDIECAAKRRANPTGETPAACAVE